MCFDSMVLRAFVTALCNGSSLQAEAADSAAHLFHLLQENKCSAWWDMRAPEISTDAMCRGVQVFVSVISAPVSAPVSTPVSAPVSTPVTAPVSTPVPHMSSHMSLHPSLHSSRYLSPLPT